MPGFIELAIIFLPLVFIFLFIAFSGGAKVSGQPASGTRKTAAIVAGVAASAIGLILLATLLAAPGTPRLGGGGGPSVLGILVFLALAALAVLALGAVVAMIINPKTRPWGITLAVVGPVALFGLLLVVPMMAWRSVSVPHPVKIRTSWDAPVVSLKPEPAPIPVPDTYSGQAEVQREIARIRADIAKTQLEIRKTQAEIKRRYGTRRSTAQAKDAEARMDRLNADVKRAEAEMAAVAKRAATAKEDAAAVKKTKPAAKPLPKSAEKPATSDATAEATEPTRESASADDAPKDDSPKSDAPKETKAERTDEPAASDTASGDKAEEAVPPSNAPAEIDSPAPVFNPELVNKELNESAALAQKDAEARERARNKRRGSAGSKRGTESDNPTSPKAATAGQRPDWIDAPPGMVGDAYQCIVVVGPYTTLLECNRTLPGTLKPAVADYVNLYRGDGAATRRLMDKLLRANVLGQAMKDTWPETKEMSVGQMTQLHVRLVFDRKINDLIKQKQHEALAEDRVWQAGLILAGVLIVLAIVYGVLKIDVATHGEARQYLLLGAGVVAFGGFGALVLSGCRRDDDAGMISTFFGLPLLLGAMFMIWRKKLRHFGWALLAGLALASLGWLRWLH